MLFYKHEQQIAMHQQHMVPDYGTQNEENPSSHHGGMRKDGQSDRRTDRQDSALAERGIRDNIIKRISMSPKYDGYGVK